MESIVGRRVFNKEFKIGGVIVWEKKETYGGIKVSSYSIVLRNNLLMNVEGGKLIKGNIWEIREKFHGRIEKVIAMNLMMETELNYNNLLKKKFVIGLRSKFQNLIPNRRNSTEITCKNIEKYLSSYFNIHFLVKEEISSSIRYLIVEWDNYDSKTSGYDVSEFVDKFRQPIRRENADTYTNIFQEIFGSYVLIMIRPLKKEHNEVKTTF